MDIYNSKKNKSVLKEFSKTIVKEKDVITMHQKYDYYHLLRILEISNIKYITDCILVSCKELDMLWNNYYLEQLIIKFLKMINKNDMNLSLGSLSSIYIIIKHKYANIQRVILNKVFDYLANYLINWYNKEELFLCICCEIITIYCRYIEEDSTSYNKKFINNVDEIYKIFFNNEFTLVKKSVFNLIISLKEKSNKFTYNNVGLKLLLDKMYKSNFQTKLLILSLLINIPFIQKTIIVHSLLNNLLLNKCYKKNFISLNILNRFFSLLKEELIIAKLKKLITCTNVDKWLLCHIIVKIQDVGEDIIIKELKKTEDLFFKIAGLKSLSFKKDLHSNYTKIKLVDYNINEDLSNFSKINNTSFIDSVNINVNYNKSIKTNYNNAEIIKLKNSDNIIKNSKKDYFNNNKSYFKKKLDYTIGNSSKFNKILCII